ncbi:hypothetical protein ACS0TY_031026 [Phlomoides rotata]
MAGSGSSTDDLEYYLVALTIQFACMIFKASLSRDHISGLSCGEWHPKDKETILTSSEDGSMRIWDVNNFQSQKQAMGFGKNTALCSSGETGTVLAQIIMKIYEICVKM